MSFSELSLEFLVSQLTIPSLWSPFSSRVLSIFCSCDKFHHIQVKSLYLKKICISIPEIYFYYQKSSFSERRILVCLYFFEIKSVFCEYRPDTGSFLLNSRVFKQWNQISFFNNLFFIIWMFSLDLIIFRSFLFGVTEENEFWVPYH